MHNRLDPQQPKTMRLCKSCGQLTPHQIQTANSSHCVRCLERGQQYELDRD